MHRFKLPAPNLLELNRTLIITVAVSEVWKYCNLNLGILAQFLHVVHTSKNTKWGRNTTYWETWQNRCNAQFNSSRLLSFFEREIQSLPHQCLINTIISWLALNFSNFCCTKLMTKIKRNHVLRVITKRTHISEFLNSYLVYWSIQIKFFCFKLFEGGKCLSIPVEDLSRKLLKILCFMIQKRLKIQEFEFVLNLHWLMNFYTDNLFYFKVLIQWHLV